MGTNVMLQPDRFAFDLLFKDFFADDIFAPVKKIHYPVDIYEDKNGIYLDIVALGTKKEDIEIEVKDEDILKVSCKNCYTDIFDAEKCVVHVKNIARRGFDFGWKIPAKFDLKKIEADLKDGLLSIKIPIKPESKPKKIKIGK